MLLVPDREARTHALRQGIEGLRTQERPGRHRVIERLLEGGIAGGPEDAQRGTQELLEKVGTPERVGCALVERVHHQQFIEHGERLEEVLGTMGIRGADAVISHQLEVYGVAGLVGQRLQIVAIAFIGEAEQDAHRVAQQPVGKGPGQAVGISDEVQAAMGRVEQRGQFARILGPERRQRLPYDVARVAHGVTADAGAWGDHAEVPIVHLVIPGELLNALDTKALVPPIESGLAGDLLIQPCDLRAAQEETEQHLIDLVLIVPESGALVRRLDEPGTT